LYVNVVSQYKLRKNKVFLKIVKYNLNLLSAYLANIPSEHFAFNDKTK
jgi:hypothetical protein